MITSVFVFFSGQMFPVLAHGRLCHLWRLYCRAEGRHFVWNLQSSRLGTHLCSGKRMPPALSHRELWPSKTSFTAFSIALHLILLAFFCHCQSMWKQTFKLNKIGTTWTILMNFLVFLSLVISNICPLQSSSVMKSTFSKTEVYVTFKHLLKI